MEDVCTECTYYPHSTWRVKLLDEDRTELERDKVDAYVATFRQPSTNEGLLRDVLTQLQEAAPEFLPDAYRVSSMDDRHSLGSLPPKILTKAGLPELCHEIGSHEYAAAMLTKGQPPTVTIYLSTAGRNRAYESVSMTVRRLQLRSPEGRREFIRATEVIFGACSAFFGDLGTTRLYKLGAPDTRGARRVIGSGLEHGLPPPRWGFLLGSEYVASLGADKLRNAPCEVIREFDDGAFLLLLAEDFETLEADENVMESRRRGLVDHLGGEFFSYVEEGKPKKVPGRIFGKV